MRNAYAYGRDDECTLIPSPREGCETRISDVSANTSTAERFRWSSWLWALLISLLFSGCSLIESGEECDFDFRNAPSRTPWGFLSGAHPGIIGERDDDCGAPDFNPGCWPYGHNESYPSWSADGQHLAYLTTDAVTRALGLYVYDLRTGDTRRIGLGPDNMSSQAWSPDGRWLTFSMVRQIWKSSIDGRCVVQLTQTGENFDPAWSPDGESIAYNNTVGPKRQGIYLIDHTTRTETWRLPANFATWHPSSNRLLATQGVGPPRWGQRLLLFHLEMDMAADTLDVMPGQVLSVTDYSPDGKYIVFTAQLREGPDVNIWRVNADGTGLVKLTENGGEMPAWSPDGRTIAYSNINREEGEGKIWLMNPDGSNRRPLRNTGMH